MFLKRLFRILALAVPMFIFSCEEKIEPSDYIISYSDLKISSFTIPDIPAAGGQVKPEVTYTYKQTTTKGKDVTEETRNVGATVRFETSAKQLSFDAVKGILEAKPNELVQDVIYEVRVYVSIANLNSSGTANARQLAAPEELLSTETVQLPLTLESHDCVVKRRIEGEGLDTHEIKYESHNTPGRITPEDNAKGYGNTFDPECISVLGEELTVKGGQIVKIDTYKSGRIDTTVITEPVFEVSTTYEIKYDGITEKYTPQTAPDNHINPPTSSYKDGKWTINKIGIGAKDLRQDTDGTTFYDKHVLIQPFVNTKHTLTATADGNVVYLELAQKENVEIYRSHIFVEVQDFVAVMQREYYNWPNIEDYPPGHNPKWLKDYEVYNDEVLKYNGTDYMHGVTDMMMQNAWHDTRDTKDMHPDGNRKVVILTRCDAQTKQPRLTYLSGEQSDQLYWHNYFGEITWARLTATAKVKMKDGTVQDIKHTYVWDLDYHFFGKTGVGNLLTAELPLIDDAAEDFQWKLSFEYKHLRPGRNDAAEPYGGILPYYQGYTMTDEEMKEYSNYYEYNWPEKYEYSVWDRKSLIRDWEDQVLSGFISCMGLGITPSSYPHYIDGEPQQFDTTIDFND